MCTKINEEREENRRKRLRIHETISTRYPKHGDSTEHALGGSLPFLPHAAWDHHHIQLYRRRSSPGSHLRACRRPCWTLYRRTSSQSSFSLARRRRRRALELTNRTGLSSASGEARRGSCCLRPAPPSCALNPTPPLATASRPSI